MKRFYITILISAFLSGPAFAVDFITPVSVTSSSNDDATPDLWPASNLIQGPGVGFNAEAPYEKLAGGPEGLWVTADDAGFPSDYVEEVGKPVLTFDLGSDTLISEINVWGYDANANGLSEFDLNFATEAEGPDGGSAMAGPFVTAGDRALGTSDFTSRQVFSFGATTARYVRLNTIDNFFVAPGDGSVVEGSLGGGDRVGLGEVSFSVPEPTSASLLVFGLFGFALRRRRN